MPKVKHASGGRSIEVPAATVAEYQTQGWVVQQPAKKAAAATRKRAAKKAAARTPDSEGTP